MSKVICIGEALIDFIPSKVNQDFNEVESYKRVAGGAPANVCACVSTLGKEAVMLTKLGDDLFGNYIIKVLREAKVNTNYILRTKEANTALAFVSLDETGNRSFSFYRNPSADMLLNKDEIKEDVFEENDILHFCSVDLVEAPVKYAHKKAIEYALKKNAIISFDPNVRLPLWENPIDCKNAILEFLPYAHIVKVSDEELEFITGTNSLEDSLVKLFVGNVKVVIFTLGDKGSVLYTKQSRFNHPGFKVEVKDTTGGGDAFIGSFIFQLLQNNVTLELLDSIDFNKYLEISNKVGSIVVSRIGAIPSMPKLDEIL